MRNSLPQRCVIWFDSEDKPVSRTSSKLGGVPYIPEGDSWPMHDDEPYSFVAQFDLAEVEKIRTQLGIEPLLNGALPTTGLLQFYLPADEDMTFGLYTEPKTPNPAGSDSHVRYYPDTSIPAQDVQQFNGEEWAPESVKADGFGADEDPYDPDFEADFTVLTVPAYPVALVAGGTQPKFNVPEPFNDAEFPEELREEAIQLLLDGEIDPELQNEDYNFLEEHRGANSLQLGGFPQFLQNDPRDPGNKDLLLLQLNEDRFIDGLSDGSTMQFFISEDDLRAGNFDRAWMYWSAD